MAMAKILVSEADPDVRRLLVVLIERLGHEAVVLDRDVTVPPCADLLLVEPESAECLENARLARTYERRVRCGCERIQRHAGHEKRCIVFQHGNAAIKRESTDADAFLR